MKTSYKQFKISEEEAGERLDKFLITKIPSVSRSKIQKMIKNGLVKINGKEKHSSYAVKPEDLVEIILESGVELKIEPQAHLKVPVIFEDENYLVLNKPAGMVVYPAEGHPEQDTVANWLLAKIPGIEKVGDPLRPGIVHRLDRETSGVMVIAKTNEAHEDLTRQFLKRMVKKTYLAWVKGQIKEDRGSISKSIGRGRGFKLITVKAGRSSFTNFEVITRKNDSTLLKIVPLTGRMHQIRVHLKSIGHPVIGDMLYGKNKSRAGTNTTRGKREPMLLHAYQIEFKDLDGNLRAYEAEMPQYFKIRNLAPTVVGVSASPSRITK